MYGRMYPIYGRIYTARSVERDVDMPCMARSVTRDVYMPCMAKEPHKQLDCSLCVDVTHMRTTGAELCQACEELDLWYDSQHVWWACEGELHVGHGQRLCKVHVGNFPFINSNWLNLSLPFPKGMVGTKSHMSAGSFAGHVVNTVISATW